MHANTIKLKKNLDVEFLCSVYNNVQKEISRPAGFPGEGNVDWSSIMLFGRNSNNVILDQYPNLGILLKKINLDIRLARFMVLGPGGIIKKHRDSFLSNEIVRLHIPVFTNPGFLFFLDSEQCDWKPGEFWYGDFSKVHYGYNGGNNPRVHLVLDVDVDERFFELLPEEGNVKNQFLEKSDAQSSSTMPLELFSSKFYLPENLPLPFLDQSKVNNDLILSIYCEKGFLFLTLNDQPFLNLVPLSEDTLLVEGVENMDIYLKYEFDKMGVKNINLIVENNKIPLKLA